MFCAVDEKATEHAAVMRSKNFFIEGGQLEKATKDRENPGFQGMIKMKLTITRRSFWAIWKVKPSIWKIFPGLYKSLLFLI